jgi:hypothetical protein
MLEGRYSKSVVLFIQYIETSVNELYRMDSHQEININNSSPNKVVLYEK